jgi:hypothetical protein
MTREEEERAIEARMWRARKKSWALGLVGVLWMFALVALGVPFGSPKFWALAFSPTVLYVVLSIAFASRKT